MADHRIDIGLADPSNEGRREDDETAYWTERFGCTAEQLKAAVAAAGTTVAAVERHLAAHA